ncbi:hypothetical protein SAMN02745126_01609 [Enhydrobacter aerosaccus]|uniref:Uncharacterized protein n=1 Tax=Enhydrobacter aerosaccus TaxID=225324 RepID=A0A1T4LM20_9HYPH|nr:hypothetical protein [Enhydrobacter aerosaccus]SJZ55666.1 hypothetical protein SAMN02745126_01609 [Enhydrobacter aerosaccus]
MSSFHANRFFAASALAAVGVGFLLAVVPAFGQPKTILPATAATCDQLRGWLVRYDSEKGSQHLSGRRFRADVALALCASGRYAEGVAILETEARNAGYTFPTP